MKKSILLLSSTFTALALPMISFADVVGGYVKPNTYYINSWIANIKYWLSQAVIILMIAMTVWFLVAVFNYVREQDPSKLADRRTVVVNSLIGLFVSVSVWGIIAILGNILGTNNDGGAGGAPVISCGPGLLNDGQGGCFAPPSLR